MGRVVLSDLDSASKLENGKLVNYRIGNVMWRSPEAQVGKGVGEPSEVFSFGLLVSESSFVGKGVTKRYLQCLYIITGIEWLHPDFDKLRRDGIEPEYADLYRLLEAFGPLPSELAMHVNDDHRGEFMALSQVEAARNLNAHFEQWDETNFPNLDSQTKRMISRMMSLDPKKKSNYG